MSGSLRVTSGCESTWMSLGVRAQGVSCGDLESPGQLWVCVHATVCSVTRIELLRQGLYVQVTGIEGQLLGRLSA